MMEAPAQPAPTVLVVDDDAVLLRFVQMALAKADIRVRAATTLAEARSALLAAKGQLDACVTDFVLPDGDGLQLLEEVGRADPQLACVVLTGQDEAELVRASLRKGAFDFLAKPVRVNVLVSAVRRALARTAENRRLNAQAEGMAAAVRIEPLLGGLLSLGPESRLRVRHRPLHDLGGDFCNFLHPAAGVEVVAVGDVSGHDAGAAFVSSFIQGTLQGLVRHGVPLPEVLQSLNEVLRRETGAGRRLEQATNLGSLALCLIEVNEAEDRLRVWNFGFPSPYVQRGDGFLVPIHGGGPPLGWLDTVPPACAEFALGQVACVRAYSDGLAAYAEERRMHPLALAQGVLARSREGFPVTPKQALDDILYMELDTTRPRLAGPGPQPVLYEQYSGAEFANIDRLQTIWRRSLTYVVPDDGERRLYDVLVCTREAVLNALDHGCERDPAKLCTLQVAFYPEQRRVRVRVDDPGRGHSFDLNRRLDQLGQDGRFLGLALISQLAQNFELHNRGTTVIFEIDLDHAPHLS